MTHANDQKMNMNRYCTNFFIQLNYATSIVWDNEVCQFCKYYANTN